MPIPSRKVIRIGICALVLLTYGFFCYLMLKISLQYIPIDFDVAFLRIKQPYVDRVYYQVAFFTHAFVAVMALPAGFTQFSQGLRRRYPQFHRWMGWLYAGSIIALAGPSGLIIGIHANGGWSSQLAFCLLAVLWVWFTWQAIVYAKRRNWQKHRNFMYRSFALTLSAITLRAWKFALVALLQPRPMDVYRWVAWLGWVVNLLLIELFISYQKHQKR